MASCNIQKREVVMCVILSIITCGIYGIIWFVKLTDESNEASGEPTASGIMAFLLTLVTCGIYYYYWAYKLGQKIAVAGKRYDKNISDNGLVYLLLSIFGLGIVTYILAQLDLNKLAE